MTKTVQPDGSVFGGLTTYRVLPTRTNSNFDHSLSESEVMAKDRFRHISEISFYKIAFEQEVITFEPNKIQFKSELVDLVQV